MFGSGGLWCSVDRSPGNAVQLSQLETSVLSLFFNPAGSIATLNLRKVGMSYNSHFFKNSYAVQCFDVDSFIFQGSDKPQSQQVCFTEPCCALCS